jgi:hypothetical protein
MISAFNRVVVTRPIAGEDLLPGDVGTVVEEYRDSEGRVIGYELELSSVEGRTLAVSSVPADAVPEATSADRPCSRTETVTFCL